MKLIVALLGPALLAVLFMESATFVANRSAETSGVQRLEWGGRVFTTEAAFERWLAARGRSYDRWRQRHPDSPWSASVANGSARSLLPPWLTTAAAGFAAAASAVVVFLLARRAVGGAVVRVPQRTASATRRVSAASASLLIRPIPAVHRGTTVVGVALASGGALGWRTVRTAGSRSRPIVGRVRRSLLAIRATAPTEARRLGSLVRLTTHDLADGARVVRHSPASRSAIAYGAVLVASGVLGIGIAFVLQ